MLGVLPLSTAPIGSVDIPGALAPLPVASTTMILVDIDFTLPTVFSLHLADRYVPASWTGTEYLGLIQAYASIDESSEASPGGAELTVTNTRPIAGKPRFSDLIRTPGNLTGTYEFVGATVTFWQLRRGTATADRLTTMYIEDAPETDDRTVRLRLRDATLSLETQAALTIISADDFPQCARDLPGAPIPVPFGRIPGVPALPIVAGTVGRLAVAVDAVATSLTVTRSDGTDLDATDFTALRVVVDWEEITFTTRTGNVLSGCTRGAASSLAAIHDVDAPVLEARTTYLYVLAEHNGVYPVQAVSNVKTTGPSSATPTISLDDTTALAGHHLVTLSFPRTAVEALKPIPSTPVTVSITEYHANLITGSGDVTFTRTVPPPAAFAYCQGTRRSVQVNFDRAGTGGNVAGSVHIIGSRYSQTEGPPGTSILDYTWADGVVGAATTSHVLSADATTPEVLSFTYHMAGTLNGGTIGVVFVYTVQVAGGGEPNRPGGPYTSAADAALGAVTADVIGLQDSAAGTITATPGLVLENPADILQYIVTEAYPTAALPLEPASWAASRETLLTRGLTWAFLYGSGAPLPLSDLLPLAARQSAGALYLEGGAWVFRVIGDTLPIARVLDYDREVWDGRAAIATRTPQSDVYTSLVVRAGWDYVTGDYRNVVTVENAGLKIQTTLELPWVPDLTRARELAAYWLDCWERPRWEVELIGWDALVPLRLGDHISLSNHPVLEAHGGAALPLHIIERSHLLGDENPARIRLRAVEAAPWT